MKHSGSHIMKRANAGLANILFRPSGFIRIAVVIGGALQTKFSDDLRVEVVFSVMPEGVDLGIDLDVTKKKLVDGHKYTSKKTPDPPGATAKIQYLGTALQERSEFGNDPVFPPGEQNVPIETVNPFQEHRHVPKVSASSTGKIRMRSFLGPGPGCLL